MLSGNANRFISAYNKIDKTLRNIYNLKANIPFSEVIRKAAFMSGVVKKFEDILLDYSRLRNAIVHSADGKKVIAEPVDEAVEQIEYILKVLSIPPLALKFAQAAVTVPFDISLKKTISIMASGNYSNMPIIQNNSICGVLTNKHIVEKIAHLSKNNEDINSALNTLNAFETLNYYKEHYTLAKADITIDEALNLFSSKRKLQILILTTNGNCDGDIKGVLTIGDIITLKEEIENY